LLEKINMICPSTIKELGPISCCKTAKS